jgi:uncharacterized protein (DUF2147 family)
MSIHLLLSLDDGDDGGYFPVMLHALIGRFPKWFGLGITLIVLHTTVYAAELSPTGLWKTIDDNTGQPRGLVRIREVSGQYEGKVERIFPKLGEPPDPKCEKCEGSRRNQPVIGMTILWGMTKQGDEYQGGEILDPENGKVYRSRMKLVDNGKKLDVRGFIGFSLFGRSQIWVREGE